MQDGMSQPVDKEGNTTVTVAQMAVTSVGKTVIDATNVEKLMVNNKDDQRATRKDEDSVTEVHGKWVIVSRKKRTSGAHNPGGK